MTDRLSRLQPYLPLGVAILAVIAVVPVKAALNMAAGRDVGFIPSVAAVVLAAWLGGFLAGIGATAVAMIIEAYAFMEPYGELAVDQDADRMRLVLFGLTGLLASWLAWLRTQAERRARVAALEAASARDRADLAVRRLSALQGIAIQLAGAVTTSQIVEVVLDHGVEALRADSATVYRIKPSGDVMVAIADRGHARRDHAPASEIDLDAGAPAAIVARTGEPMFVEDAAEPAAGEAESLSGGVAGHRAWAIAPVELEDLRFGVLEFAWSRPHQLPDDRRAFIAALALLCGTAIERARLYDAERAAQRRLDLVVDAGRALAMSLDYEITLHRLPGLALPDLGDIGIVDVLEPGGVRRIVATSRPDLTELARSLEAHPLDPDGGGPMSSVLHSGRAGVVRVDRDVIEAAARDPEHAAILAGLDPRHALVTPLRVLNRTTGVLALLRCEDRPYEPEDVAVIGELGDRAGRALENARLHTQVGQLAAGERRRAAELEAVVASIGEGILVTDPDGSIASSNGAAVRLLGGPVRTLDELLDRLLDTDGERPTQIGNSPGEYRLANRHTAWVEVTAYPVARPSHLDAASEVIVCRDVSAFRQGQALREAFLGLLSHELRTPVTTIYGGSAVLVRPDHSLDRATQQEILSDIAGEADRLYRLVEDLLVLARFDEGMEVGSEPALLQRLVPAVIDQERGRWPGIRFEVQAKPDLPAVSGDETSITQVVRNLISNAAKYSGANGTVRVEIEPGQEGVVVRVRDEGVGIDPAEAEDLFSPFYRSAATARMAGGAGIGLYVSRRLVDAMGGRIWAAALPERGSEFGFVLRPYEGPADD